MNDKEDMSDKGNMTDKRKYEYSIPTREEMEKRICKIFLNKLGNDEMYKFSMCKNYMEKQKHMDDIHKKCFKESMGDIDKYDDCCKREKCGCFPNIKNEKN